MPQVARGHAHLGAHGLVHERVRPLELGVQQRLDRRPDAVDDREQVARRGRPSAQRGDGRVDGATRSPSAARSSAWRRCTRAKARVVELRSLGGLTAEEAAGVLGVSRETVKKDCHLARAWLNRELRRGEER